MEKNAQLLTHDSQVRWLLSIATLVQVIFCVTQVGFLHPDQHFQLIEFSSWQLGEPSGATSVWELNSHIRPTLQVYLFSGFIKLCRLFRVHDAYGQLTILRIVFGLLGFTLFNTLVIHYFKHDKKLLYVVLLLVNFSWSLPYVRTLFSSEVASSIVFFGGILLYELKGTKFLYVVLTGFLFSLAFYFRFQIAFGLVGFGLWLLIIEKKYAHLLPMAIGFSVGIGINLVLDYQFYHQFVFTPYDYYRVNITEGKAAEFGTSNFVWYILILAVTMGAPPLSIFLFYYGLKGAINEYRQPIVFAVVFFVLGHCFVGHKEERFMFPVLNVLPIITGWGLAPLITYYQQSRTYVRSGLKGVLFFSVALNGLILTLFLILNPYYQAIEFTRKLTNTFKSSNPTIYCLSRTPFETKSRLPLTFYRRNAPNINLIRFQNADSARYLKNAWVVSTYNDAKGKLAFFDSLGFKPRLYSSAPLWKANQFLESKKINTINEIWVLYRKE